ncbi:phosphoribosylaminoimidazolecarboxamide formyltransferase [Flindersiella endophytica]
MHLRYGTNPHQAARATPVTPGTEPITVLNGQPSYINLLDALNGWQLVREAAHALGIPAAASFKHVSPAGTALAGPIDDVTAELYGVADPGDLASAYLRARDADPRSSFGDFAAVSHPVDAELAELLTTVVCDGIVAPGYAPGTVATLARKKRGSFLVIEADQSFTPPEQEHRDVFGLRLTQDRDQPKLHAGSLELVTGDPIPPRAAADLLLGMATLRFTQSNSVCYVRDGATLGIGAGQQSRVDCTRLGGAKADTWWLRRHPAVRALTFPPGTRRQDRINEQIRYLEDELTAAQRDQWIRQLTGVAFVSDGALPFRDNVDHAHRHGVKYIAEPGGSIRSGDVAAVCREHGITLARTGLRLFHH